MGKVGNGKEVALESMMWVLGKREGPGEGRAAHEQSGQPDAPQDPGLCPSAVIAAASLSPTLGL